MFDEVFSKYYEKFQGQTLKFYWIVWIPSEPGVSVGEDDPLIQSYRSHPIIFFLPKKKKNKIKAVRGVAFSVSFVTPVKR